MKKNKARICTLLAVISVLLLGAKGCDNKAAIIENLPELNKIADKFEIEETEDAIILTTYDNLSFKEAIDILKNKTPMNNPISFYNTNWGEYKSEIPAAEEMDPYTGIIFICDGWWRAIELDANTDETVYITEYAYCNDTVYELNKFDPKYDNYFYFLSLLDEDPGNSKIQGDGSTKDTTILEFDK